jgi:small-conductance mechanosensitive channel
MKKRTFLSILFLFFVPSFVCADIAGIALPQGDQLFVGQVENRQKQLEKLKNDREEHAKIKQNSEQELKALAEETKTHIDRLESELKEKPDSAFLKQKQSLLGELYQLFRDLLRDRERTLLLFDELIRTSTQYLEDPDFNAFRKEYRLGERLFYSFDDLQRLYNLILDQEKKVGTISDEEKHSISDMEARKRAAGATKEGYQAKKEQIETGTYADNELLNTQERSELFTLEERIFSYRKLFDSLRVKESKLRVDLLSLQLSIEKAHLAIFKEYLKTIKIAVRVTEADIVHAREELNKKVQNYRVTKEKYRSEIDALLIQEERVQKRLQELAKKYAITLGRDITEWSRETLSTPEAYLAYCEVATLQAQLSLVQKKQEFLEGQLEREDEKIKDETLSLLVKTTYHKKFTTEEEIALELKKYEGPLAESQAALSRSKERLSLVADQINNQKKILDNIEAFKQELLKKKETVFKSAAADYRTCLAFIRQAELLEKEQIDLLGKLTGVYSGVTSYVNNKLRLIGFIKGELESRTIWYRPEYAITWQGIKNIIPDIITFLTFVRNYFTGGTFISTIGNVWDLLKEPMYLVVLLFKLLGLCIALFVLYRMLPRIRDAFLAISAGGVGRMLGVLLAGIAEFLYVYFYQIALWILLFAALLFQNSVDTYIYILFYLGSIPYLLYLANRFTTVLAQYNEEHEFAFVAADFQRRFWFVLSVLMYSTITIVFFREAFMLAHFYRSELPTILLAVNFIIFQIGLILLLDKEQILSFIPTKTEIGQWFGQVVDKYYYLILLMIITIIVMSNPYVGFGRLVLYALFGWLYSIMLLIILYYLHGLIKRISSQLFFVSVDDVARERFANAKTWFGITIIVSFLTLGFTGLIVAAKIWGWPITLPKIKELLEYPIIGMGTESPITFFTFAYIVLFVAIGFIIAYALNKFVLDRIFDLLLVDPGVQHTITSLTQYSVIITFVFLGFQNAKLGALVNYIVGGLILGLGWVLKEPISDFVAYFIILVQRPIKIGDFIRIDDEVTGVVRKITARSVILRRKNSTTLVVPNSLLISKTIVNWNYTRNFIAFDDIHIMVDYDEDPETVRQALYEVLDMHPTVLKNPKPWVRLDNFGEYGYDFMVRGFISSVYTLEKWEIASNIRLSIVKAFQEKSIKLALPIHVLVSKNAQTSSHVSRIKSGD